MHLRALILSTVTVLCTSGAAATDRGTFGLGAAACDSYVSAAPTERAAYVQWSMGFIVGMAAASTHELPLDLTEASVSRLLQTACERDRSKTVFAAAAELAKSLQVGQYGHK